MVTKTNLDSKERPNTAGLTPNPATPHPKSGTPGGILGVPTNLSSPTHPVLRSAAWVGCLSVDLAPLHA